MSGLFGGGAGGAATAAAVASAATGDVAALNVQAAIAELAAEKATAASVAALDTVAAQFPLAIDNVTDPNVAMVTSYEVPYLASILGAGATVASTVAETTLMPTPWTVAAAGLGVGDVVKIVAWGNRFQNVAGTSTIRIRVGGVAGVSLGNVVLPDLTISATARPWRWETELRVIAGTGALVQFAWGGRMSQADPAAAANTDWQKTHQATSTGDVDAAVAQDWHLTVVHSVSNSALSVTLFGFHAYIVKDRP